LSNQTAMAPCFRRCRSTPVIAPSAPYDAPFLAKIELNGPPGATDTAIIGAHRAGCKKILVVGLVFPVSKEGPREPKSGQGKPPGSWVLMPTLSNPSTSMPFPAANLAADHGRAITSLRRSPSSCRHPRSGGSSGVRRRSCVSVWIVHRSYCRWVFSESGSVLYGYWTESAEARVRPGYAPRWPGPPRSCAPPCE